MLELTYLLVNVISSQTELCRALPIPPGTTNRDPNQTAKRGTAQQRLWKCCFHPPHRICFRKQTKFGNTQHKLHQTKDIKIIISDNHVVCRGLSLPSQPGLLVKRMGGETSTFLTKLHSLQYSTTDPSRSLP